MGYSDTKMNIVSPLKTSLFGIVELLVRHDRRKELKPTYQGYRICGCPKEEIKNHRRDPYLKKQMANFPGNPRAPTEPGPSGAISPERRLAFAAPAPDRLEMDDDQVVRPAREQDPKRGRPFRGPRIRVDDTDTASSAWA